MADIFIGGISTILVMATPMIIRYRQKAGLSLDDRNLRSDCGDNRPAD